MSRSDDDDDVTADQQLIAGRVAPGDEALAQLLAVMRAMADGPEPRPSAALEALMTPAPRPAPQPARAPAGRVAWRRALRWAAGLGIAGKVALGAGVAVAATTGVATIPAVPDAVQRPVNHALVRVERFLVGESPEVEVREPDAPPAPSTEPGDASPAAADPGRSAAVPKAPDDKDRGTSTDEPGQDGPAGAPGSDEDAKGTPDGPSSQGLDSRSTTAPTWHRTLVPGWPAVEDGSTEGTDGREPADPTPSPSETSATAQPDEGQGGGNGTASGGSEPQE